MEWDKIKQKWTEMTARVQSPRLPGDKITRSTKETGEQSKRLVDTFSGDAGIMPVGDSDERPSV